MPRRLAPQRDHPERDALALANDGLAWKVALRWRDRAKGFDLDDLLQEARVGLLLAAETYTVGRAA